MTQIVVPTLGESVTEATVAQWLKKEGEPVKADEPIVELETDKVTLEVNAPQDGVITSITVAEGENVEVGAVLGELSTDDAANDIAPEPAAKEEAPKEEVKAEEKEESADDSSLEDAASELSAILEEEERSSEAGKTSPAVRKALADNELKASDVSGTGKEGRITTGDVKSHVERAPETGQKSQPAPVAKESAPTPSTSDAVASSSSSDDAGAPLEERVRMTKLRKTIASRLKEAQNTAAMLTTFNEVDMGAVMELRKEYKDDFEKKHGVKLGFMSFFVRAAIQALKEFPSVNAEIDGDEIVYKNYYNVGVAVSTPQGLVVPVLRDADKLSMAQIESGIMDLGLRARDGKLSMAEMMGGTFTITNGGIFGSMLSTPILNTPQSGILGMHNIVQRPMVMADGSIEARPIMYLAHSYDHRIIDGREAVSFLVRIKQAIEDPQRLLLDL